MNLFEHVQSYPDHPGYRGTDTSRSAANFMKDRFSRLQLVVVAALRDHGPLATFEIATRTDLSYRSIQPRTAELRAKGTIRDSRTRRVDPETGKEVIVWELVR